MSVEERMAALEARLQAAEDQLEIIQLLNTYGPLVDSGESTPAARLWVVGGGYDFSGGSRLAAPYGLVAMYDSEGHRNLINTGCSHLTATPRIELHGDTAEAVAYSYVMLKAETDWNIWRASINHWKLTRTADGWRIVERYNRVLDGSAESHETMRRVLG